VRRGRERERERERERSLLATITYHVQCAVLCTLHRRDFCPSSWPPLKKFYDVCTAIQTVRQRCVGRLHHRHLHHHHHHHLVRVLRLATGQHTVQQAENISNWTRAMSARLDQLDQWVADRALMSVLSGLNIFRPLSTSPTQVNMPDTSVSSLIKYTPCPPKK